MSTTSYGNLKLDESQNVVQKYMVPIVTAGDATTATGELVFDQPFVDVPDVMNVYVLDTDGTIRPLLSDIFADTITTTGLTVNLAGLYDTDGPVNIDAATFNCIVLLHGHN